MDKSLKNMLSALFWHSILMTFTTPLYRLFEGKWKGGLSIPFILNRLGISELVWGRTLEEVYLYYPSITTPIGQAIDQPFVIHAALGLLWIITAYIQMRYTSHIGTPTPHRRFGAWAILAFSMHIVAACRTLYMDPMVHHPLSKLLLLVPATGSVVSMVQAIRAAKRGDYIRHQDEMIRCFVYSIEGSGPIRSITHLTRFMLPAVYVATDCQSKFDSLATHCGASYVLRLALIRIWTLMSLAWYNHIRRDTSFTRSYYMELVLTTIILAPLGFYVYIMGVDVAVENLRVGITMKETAAFHIFYGWAVYAIGRGPSIFKSSKSRLKTQ